MSTFADGHLVGQRWRGGDGSLLQTALRPQGLKGAFKVLLNWDQVSKVTIDPIRIPLLVDLTAHYALKNVCRRSWSSLPFRRFENSVRQIMDSSNKDPIPDYFLSLEPCRHGPVLHMQNTNNTVFNCRTKCSTRFPNHTLYSQPLSLQTARHRKRRRCI